ncbi:MAG: hypothetical protein ABEJ97_08890 [Halobellus sp.]
MTLETVAAGLVGVLVFGGLALHERIVDALATVDGGVDDVE